MRLHKKPEPYLFLILPVLVYLAVVLIPIISSIYYSFIKWDGIGDKEFTGISNYLKLFKDPNLPTILLNTLKYSFVCTFVQVFVGLFLAILVMSVPKGRNFIRALLFVPVVLSGMAMAQTFKKLLSINPDGVLNAFLGMIGIQKIAFLASYKVTLYVAALFESFRFCGLYMVIFYAALYSIDESALEAAAIDGANFWNTLLHIRIPLIKGIIVSSVVLSLVGTLKAFESPFILTNGGPGYTSELLATYMYKFAFNKSNYGYSSTLGLLLLFICLVSYLLINKLTSEKKVRME